MDALGQQKADAAVKFLRSLRHVKDPWAGVNFTLLGWQERIIRNVYGTLKPDGTRQYKHVYVELPKKMGKSEWLAGLGLKQLCADDEWAAEVYGCAADREQASIIYDIAVAMVDQEPELQAVCQNKPSKKRIIYLPTKSFYQVLSSEAFTKHGLNVSAVLFDELHAQPNRELFDVMTFGSGDARRQPLFFYITTAGDDPARTSVGWEVHKKAVDILLGNRVDPTWYPVIWGHEPEQKRIWRGWTHEAYEDLTWESEELWQKVNPSLDHTVKTETLREAYRTVKGSPAEERLFRQLRLNEWVKSGSAKWLPLEKWDSSAGKIPHDQLWDRLKGRYCYGGLDLSTKIDLTAFLMVFPPQVGDPNHYALPVFWVPEGNVKERVRRDSVPYDRWVAESCILTTPGNVIDYAFIRHTVNELRKSYEIREIGYDPWNATQTSLELTDDGFLCVEVRQGYKTMSEPMKTIEALARSDQLRHGGHPVLRWNVDNCQAKMDENENIRPVKNRSTERIDGVVAMLNAFDRALRHEPDTIPAEAFIV